MYLATATHNFKCVKIIHIYLISDQTFVNLYVKTLIWFPIIVIQPAHKMDLKLL